MSTRLNVSYLVEPGAVPRGEIQVPGDKSISHRAVMLGAIAAGETRIDGILEGEDVLATIAAMRAMGVSIEGPKGGRLTIQGAGEIGLSRPSDVLDMGNSGTAMRLLCGLLCGQSFEATLVGDESLSRRPMERVAQPLREMGARIDTRNGCPPLVIRPSPDGLQGRVHHLKVASAQLKSALLLAGLHARGETRVFEPAPTRDHTERMLEGFGCHLYRGEDWVSIAGGQSLRGCRIVVPGDISSAAFFMVAAAIVPGAEVLIRGVGVNPTRTGIVEVLRAMGAFLEIREPREVAGEPVADILVRGGALRGIDVAESVVPLAIDEFPAICVAAAAAKGITRIRGAGELRVKESDRIDAMADGLGRLGISVTQHADGLDVVGGTLRGGRVDSHGDHRIAMSLAVAGLVADAPVEVTDCRNVATSFPGFVQCAGDVGIAIRERIDAGD